MSWPYFGGTTERRSASQRGSQHQCQRNGVSNSRCSSYWQDARLSHVSCRDLGGQSNESPTQGLVRAGRCKCGGWTGSPKISGMRIGTVESVQMEQGSRKRHERTTGVDVLQQSEEPVLMQSLIRVMCWPIPVFRKECVNVGPCFADQASFRATGKDLTSYMAVGRTRSKKTRTSVRTWNKSMVGWYLVD